MPPARPSSPPTARRERVTRGRVPFKHLLPAPSHVVQAKGGDSAARHFRFFRGAEEPRAEQDVSLGVPLRAPSGPSPFSPFPRRRLSGGSAPAGRRGGGALGSCVAGLPLFLECPLCPAGGMPRCGAGLGREEEPLSRRSCHVGGAKRI